MPALAEKRQIPRPFTGHSTTPNQQQERTGTPRTLALALISRFTTISLNLVIWIRSKQTCYTLCPILPSLSLLTPWHVARRICPGASEGAGSLQPASTVLLCPPPRPCPSPSHLLLSGRPRCTSPTHVASPSGVFI